MKEMDMSDVSYYDDENECNECNDNQIRTNIFQFDYDYTDDVLKFPETFYDNYENCLNPSIFGTLEYLLPLIAINIIFKLIVTVQTASISTPKLLNILSTIFGVYIIYHYVPECLHLLLIYAISSYGCLCLLARQYLNQRISIFVVSLVIILYCEYAMNPEAWHKIRSVMMIAAMKTISICFDNVNNSLHLFLLPPSQVFLQYTGYIFHPSTCLFGPWISYQDYITLLTRLEYNTLFMITLLFNILHVLKNLLLSIIFLAISNCWSSWLITDEWRQITGGKWLLAYKDALSFRTSHYFISYLSAALLTLGSSVSSNISSLTIITKPIAIEMPRSLVQVVIFWNIPMHTWLKLYIFRPAVKNVGKFNAVILTYLTSSLLHGLNFQLAAVLLSLGLYTYVEFQLRNILANTFDACIASKECTSFSSNTSNNKVCRYKRHWYNNGWVFLMNLGFFGLSVFHLAYLGLMFDTSESQVIGYSYSHTIAKWSDLGFASHWIIFIMYLIYFFIK